MSTRQKTEAEPINLLAGEEITDGEMNRRRHRHLQPYLIIQFRQQHKTKWRLVSLNNRNNSFERSAPEERALNQHTYLHGMVYEQYQFTLNKNTHSMTQSSFYRRMASSHPQCCCRSPPCCCCRLYSAAAAATGRRPSAARTDARCEV